MPIQYATRAAAAGVTLRFTMASTQGKLYALRRSGGKKDTELHMACPIDGDRLEQFYIGECGHGPADLDPPGEGTWFKTGDAARGRATEDGKLVLLSAEEIAATKSSDLPEKELELQFCPAAELDAQTWPGGSAYWFEPDKGDAFYALLCQSVSGDIAAFGVMNLSKSEKLFRLYPLNGGLALQELIRPQEMVDVTPVPATCSPKEEAVFGQLMDGLAEPFDPEAVRSNRAERLAALVAEKTGVPLAAVPATKKSAPTQPDLTDVLEAALAASIEAKKAQAA